MLKSGRIWTLIEIYVGCLLIIMRLSPVEHENKLLSKAVRKKNRKNAWIEVLVLGGGAVVTYQRLPEVSFVILATLIEVALLMLIGKGGR